MKLAGPQSCYRRFGGEKNSLPPIGIRAPDRPARKLVPAPTALHRHSDWAVVLLCISHIRELISSIPSIVIMSLVNTALKQNTTYFSAFCTTDHYCPSSPLAFLYPDDKLMLLPPTVLYVRVGAVCWGTALQAWRSRVPFPVWSLEFLIDLILSAALWTWVDWASNRNEYHGYLLGGRGIRCVGFTSLPPSCADCLEILGASISLEPWRPIGL